MPQDCKTRVILIQQICMLPKCYNSSRDLRTVFVFAPGPFLPMWVLFYFNGNFDEKMAKITPPLDPSGHFIFYGID